MLLDAEAEDNLNKVLAAYIEEWGHANVVVVVPQSWSALAAELITLVRYELSAEDRITIRVCQADLEQCSFSTSLQVSAVK